MRLLVGVLLVATLGGAGALAAALRPASPAAIPALRPPAVTDDEKLIAATFPPRWSVGRSWALEVEQDARGFDIHWHPSRYFVRHHVVAAAAGRVVVQWEVVDEEGPAKYFVVSLEPFQLRHADVTFVPEDWTDALLTNRRLSFDELDEPATHGCSGGPRPWPVPYSRKHDFLGRELIGARIWPRTFEDRSQSASVLGDAGIVFTIEEANRPRAPTALIRWRPGEPWWAKLECRPLDAQNLPRPHLASGARPFRARLVAVDEQPVDVLPWEFPPVDWLAGGRASDGEPPPPSGLTPFDEYRERRKARRRSWTMEPASASSGSGGGGPAPPVTSQMARP